MIANARNIMTTLWERSAGQLDNDALEFFADGIDIAAYEAENLANATMNIACLINSDEIAGNFKNSNNTADLLFNMAHQMDVIVGLIHIGAGAKHRLENPDLYNVDASKPPSKTTGQ